MGPVQLAPFVALGVGCLVLAGVGAFGGYLYGNEFASGPRQPVESAICWAASAVALSVPLAVAPSFGIRVRWSVTMAAAGALAVVWFVTGMVLTAA